MNRICLIGRLTRRPELKSLTSGTTISNFTLAVDRRFKQEGLPDADFFPCVAFSKTAEVLYSNCDKGQQLGISGRIQNRSFEGRDGVKRTITEVIVDSFTFCGKRDEQKEENQEQTSTVDDDFYLIDPEDDDVPF